MSLETKYFYEFENFRLDPAEKVLLRDGKPLSVTPKAFHLLEILVENHGHIVEKKKLLSEIWAHTFVEDGNLTFNVRMLRKVLEDDAQHPRFIETVPRRGYRFVAEVRKIFLEETPSTAPVPENNSSFKSPRNYFSSLASIASIILLFCAVIAAAWFVRSKTVKPVSAAATTAPVLSAPFHSEKLTNTGNVAIAAVSPDGTYVAYVDKTNDKFGIWLRRLETSERIQIIQPTDDFYLGIAFTHDGQSIYFVRKPQNDEQAQPSVFRVSIFGGVPEKILERAEGWISLSPDDRQISFVRCAYKIDDFCSLMLADANGQNERKLVSKASPVRIGDNQFSPDGTSIAFAVGESWSGSYEFGLKQINISDGAESGISQRKFFDVKNLKWLPDGSTLLLTAMENLGGRIKIWEISAATGEAHEFTNDAANYESLSLSKSADKIIASQLNNDFRLYILSDFSAAKALTNANCFAFAPNGKIVYSTFEGDIWTINRENSEQRQLTSGIFTDFAPIASPDGRFVFFTSNRTGSNQIWRMDASDGSNQTQLTNAEGGYPHFVSPDGKWIYYESGLHQTLWKVSTEGGEETEVYDKKVFAPAFSPDGHRVAYFFRDQKIKIGIVNLEDKKLFRVFDLADTKDKAVRLAWMNNNQSVEYITKNGSENRLWSQSLNETNSRFLAELGDGEINDFELAPNDNSIALVRGDWLHDAVLIEGLK